MVSTLQILSIILRSVLSVLTAVIAVTVPYFARVVSFVSNLFWAWPAQNIYNFFCILDWGVLLVYRVWDLSSGLLSQAIQVLIIMHAFVFYFDHSHRIFSLTGCLSGKKLQTGFCFFSQYWPQSWAQSQFSFHQLIDEHRDMNRSWGHCHAHVPMKNERLFFLYPSCWLINLDFFTAEHITCTLYIRAL